MAKEIELKNIGHNNSFLFGGVVFEADRNDEFTKDGETFIGCKIRDKKVYIVDSAFVLML